MRILVVTSYFWPEDFRINDLAADLAARGHAVTVFTGIPNYPKGSFFEGYGLFAKRTEDYRGVTIRRHPLVPRGGGRSWNLALNYLSALFFGSVLAPLTCRDRYDVIFVCQLSPATVGIPAAVMKRLQAVPMVLWVLDLWPESLAATGAVTSPMVLGWVRAMVRWIYGKCDRILVSSRGFVGGVSATGGYQGVVEHFPNWVEPEYAEEAGAHAVGPRELPAGFRLVFAGNIGEAQDFPTLLAAADRLRSISDLHWVILGDGRKLEWVQAEVKRRCLQGTFHVLGRYPSGAMPGFYAQADALLVSLRQDPLFALTAPGKLTSYLASGRPVVAALAGEGARIVDEAGAGVVSPPGNPELLAERILQLYRSPPEERARMGASGKAYCARHFERKRLLDRLEQVLCEVTSNTRAVPVQK